MQSKNIKLFKLRFLEFLIFNLQKPKNRDVNLKTISDALEHIVVVLCLLNKNKVTFLACLLLLLQFIHTNFLSLASKSKALLIQQSKKVKDLDTRKFQAVLYIKWGRSSIFRIGEDEPSALLPSLEYLF